eukprot:TRINITY_DN458_c0_g1_i1.p1 TRINITY_DN458_c0_g1~~TRINITY_DN458_c0_g1_i1.p1  ORF type:complete len:595 (-),score=162.43 TRINITY_DN458_c0_g1_i1:164-1948(-)
MTQRVCPVYHDDVQRPSCADGCQKDYYNPCGTFKGCPVGYYTCPNGNCVSDVGECSGSCNQGGMYECSDKSCLSDPTQCYPPQFWKCPALYENTQYVTTTGVWNISTFLNGSQVLSSIKAYNRIPMNSNVTVKSFGCVPESSYSSSYQDSWATKLPGVPGYTKYFDNIFSPIISFTIQGSSTFYSGTTLTVYLSYDTNRMNELNYTCLGYLKDNIWSCVNDGTRTYQYLNNINNNNNDNNNTTLIGEVFSGEKSATVIASGFYKFTLAIIRYSWRNPVAKEVVKDFSQVYNASYLSTTLNATVSSVQCNTELSSSSSSSCTLNVNSSDQAVISSTITSLITTRYKFSSQKVLVSSTLDGNGMIVTFNVSDTVFLIPTQPPTSAPTQTQAPYAPTVVAPTSSPTSTPTTQNSAPTDATVNQNSSFESNLGLYIGIIVGVLIIVIVFVIIIVMCVCGKSKGSADKSKRGNSSRSAAHSRVDGGKSREMNTLVKRDSQYKPASLGPPLKPLEKKNNTPADNDATDNTNNNTATQDTTPTPSPPQPKASEEEKVELDASSKIETDPEPTKTTSNVDDGPVSTGFYLQMDEDGNVISNV